ncbi:hypothetical protein RRG08_046927 [Elysia crispata]|uniref:Uncharacterized protein n=1 Tax=Elysia crispata TaxID=231223 RepID=A0AAE1A9W2_9GAST|nr:hypothetical protein RRG08_046927 [Elysia crispata]
MDSVLINSIIVSTGGIQIKSGNSFFPVNAWSDKDKARGRPEDYCGPRQRLLPLIGDLVELSTGAPATFTVQVPRSEDDN